MSPSKPPLFFIFLFIFFLSSHLSLPLVFSVSKRRSRRRLSSRRVPPASTVCSVGRPIETTTDDHSLGPHGVYVCLLRQKTDPNPPWTTIMSVLTSSPPDWRFSQVSGDRCGGEEVHEGKPHPSSILIPCISDSV